MNFRCSNRKCPKLDKLSDKPINKLEKLMFFWVVKCSDHKINICTYRPIVFLFRNFHIFDHIL